MTSCTLRITYHRKYLRLHTSCEPSYFTLATTGRTSACSCSLCSSRGATPTSVLVMPFRILPAPLHTQGPRPSHSFQTESASAEEVSSKSSAQRTYPAAGMARRHTGSHTGRWSRGGAEERSGKGTGLRSGDWGGKRIKPALWICSLREAAINFSICQVVSTSIFYSNPTVPFISLLIHPIDRFRVADS